MGVFENGVSALQALQRAMNTTSHNISNVNTDGYSRQRTEFTTRTPLGAGNGFSGSGVEVETVRRIFDQTRETSVQRNTSEYQRLETLANSAGRIDDMLGDESSGISSALQDFYGAVQDVAADPSSATSRDTLLTQARNLSSRFRGVGEQLRGFNDDVNTQLKGKTAEVNQLAGSIADLNQEISVQSGRFGEPPNDLLDQRDQLVRELSGLVDTRTVEASDGSLNVFVGTGQTLVSGFSNSELTTVRPDGDPTRLNVAITTRSGGTTDISRQIGGGEIGGLLDYRENVLNPTREEIDRMAAGLAQTFNAQHRDGLQFGGGNEGGLGGDLFSLGGPGSVADGATVDSGFAAFDPESEPALNGVRLTFDQASSQWTAENVATGDTQTFQDNDQVVSFAGMNLDMGKVSGASDGATISVDPLQDAATGMRVAIDRPSQVAVAAPLRVGEVSGNDGDAAVDDFSVDSIDGLPSGGPAYRLEYTDSLPGGGTGYELVDGGGNAVNDGAGNPVTIAYDPATDAAGKAFSVDVALGGGNTATVSGALSGRPEVGDAFTLERNTGAVGDSSNAVALGDIAEQGVFDGGDTTLQEFYAGLVGEVGTKTLQAQTGRDAQESVLEQARAARDEVSGVNLDEEAADLMRFQQAYQAAAQSISIARTTFDALLSATRG
ncbi:flagellar hook-associated protein FlgK [Arhodomonas aquaeolei]|uniref:flagellar hook-associated protein FlgK n=1 Tax=Arhodomonas aquaeolei TaxID=2369 RepID=UPI00036826BE|nr:flagellar hook-associated protein FlgK [Arhodomonas aquaeolei]